MGRFLVEYALTRPVIAGRTHAIGVCATPPGDPHGQPDVEFAKALGAEISHVDVRRRLLLPTPPDHLVRLDAENRRRWEDRYRIDVICGGIPEKYLGGYCAAYNQVMVDAPTGLIEYQPELLTPEQEREMEAAREGAGFTRVLALAVSADDEVAGYSELMVIAGSDQVQQADTFVVCEHRGSGLGLALKIAAIRKVVEVAPSATEIITANGEANPWMVRINEKLGFEPVEQDVVVLRRV